MDILIVIGLVYCIHLADKWLDKRSAEKWVDRVCGSRKHF